MTDAHLEEIQPDPAPAAVILNLKGTLYQLKNQPSEAKAMYTESIRQNDQYIPPYLSLAKLLTQEKKTDDAVRIYQRLISKRPALSSPYTFLAMLQENQGQFDKAAANYEKSIELKPDDVPALNNLAFLYADQGRKLDRALELALAAQKIVPESLPIIDTLGWVYYKKQMFKKAIEAFNTCIEKDPENPLFYYHLGLAHHGNGDPKETKAALEKALALDAGFKGAAEARTILSSL